MADVLAENEMNPVEETNVVEQVEVANITETVTNNVDVETLESTDNSNNVIVQNELNTDNTEVTSPQNDAVENIQDNTNSTVSESAADVASVEVSEAPKVEHQQSAHKQREHHNPKFDAIYEQLKTVKENNGTIEVYVKERIKGGLRVIFDDLPMFLPASHFALKRNPTEQQMKDALGKKLEVHIHEMQEDETKRKTVIVSRKQILEDKFWNSLKVGDVIEGPVTSIASFGIFIDVYGVEGLVHVTRLSNTRIEDLKAVYKKGQLLKAVIVDINKDKKRIGLSTKELEDSPWKGISLEVTQGSTIKGIIRRITEFGAYVEIKPGVDALCRASEISWTKRIKHPNEFFTVGQEMEFFVAALNEDKKTISLSIKRFIENPWKSISEKYPLKTKVNAVIKYHVAQGAVLAINDEVDGFMPRSKMRFLPKGMNNPGDTVEILIDSIDLEKEAMIVVPANEEKPEFKPKEKPKFEQQKRHKEPDINVSSSTSDSAAFTLQDLLSDAMKKNLLKS